VIERLEVGLGQTRSELIASSMEIGELGPKPCPTSKTSKASSDALRPYPLLVGQTKGTVIKRST
jgi:hypothetical protein